ncbi:MAG: hypothetical protein ABI954_11025 [Pyrinomonadaceae bacterium]
MKNFLASLVVMALLVIMLPLAGNAQTRRAYYYKDRNGVVHKTYKKPSFYRRHRNAVNIGAGTAGGAILGGIIGGKKGMAVGSAAGAGGSALYTYKLKKKKRRYIRRRSY